MGAGSFDVLTFDCYGTLIDWESGILSVLRAILASHDKQLSDEDVLALYGELEAEAEAGPYQSYREVLAAVTEGFGERLGFVPTVEEKRALATSLPQWQPWPDTVAALRKLQGRYRLAVISNIDDDLFATSQQNLGVPFEHVITAERARCYKPGLAIFRKALAEIAAPPSRILHVGQSIYHDVLPAQSLGLFTAWVNRPSRRKDVGAVRKVEGKPDLEVSDLKSLAERLDAEST